MADDKSVIEKRRFQRVHFEIQEGKDQSISGLQAVWFQGERVSVFDISYTGAAVVRPKKTELQVCHIYALKFEFEGQHICEINAEVMWFNDSMVGLAFSELSGEDRIRFSDFLDDKLIGANLKRVKDEFIGPNSNFDMWLQGPKDSAVFAWMSDSKEINKLQVNLDENVFEWEKGKGVVLGSDILNRVLDLLSQIEEEKESFRSVYEQLLELKRDN